MSDEERLRTLFQGGTEGDLRFQFEIIKGLGESVRSLAGNVQKMQETQIDMLTRIARIESNRVNEDVARNATRIDALQGRVDSLESDKDRRDGGSALINGIIRWWPVIGVLFTVLYLLFRSVGIIHIPADEQKAPIIVPIDRPSSSPPKE